jgi:hypothetical protein
MRGRWERLGVILVAMILVGCGASTGGTVGSGTGGPTPTVTPTPPPTPTPSPTAASGGASMQALGWTKAHLGYPDAVAAAPSDPTTLYACTGDPTGNLNPAGTIAFSVSHDGGATWQTTNTPVQAGRCESLEVSPTDAQAVAFLAATCRQDCGQGYYLISSSLDGGAHWTTPALPSGGELGVMVPFAWVGTTLFAAVGNPAPHVLAASKNAGAFTWVNTTFAPAPFTAVGNTLYAYVSIDSSSCPKDSSSECLEIAKTSDLGASWSRILPLYQGYNVRALDVLPDGVAMIGQETRAATSPDVYPLLRSTDGGASWQALPDFPQGTGSNDSTAIFATPDGAAFVRLPFAPGATPCTIYKLSPGASAWACSAQATTGAFGFALVTWDVHGHPAKVWAFVDAGYGITDLWSHPA